ncbi:MULTISPECIES: hypothetical protein [unclassified Acinetobacter]|uniref:hypothetical protein n=1 Tax=unclassified Acinetobacter TaxID=196816 RepID=UPI0025C1B098|nr:MULTISPECIES: hypothetical protein [unclassified Acinetobacter]
MHSPRPYGLLVINGELTEKDNLFIDHQLKKLSNQKAISNLENVRQVKDLPDGGYVILQDMGGMLKAIAHKELLLDEFEPDGLAKIYVPMLYSGVITKARIRKEEGVGFKITEQCRRRLINYSNDALPNKELHLQRFIIEPNAQTVPEFIPQNNFSDFITTQYVQQRPTWYSGAMAEVMQIVGGYGRQDFNNLPDLPFEKSRIQIPEKYMERIAQEIEGIRLPAYSGIPPLDGAFQYDYKFHSTNGVVFDTTNKPWLIRIRSNGVFAMPMPIVPVTATQTFREYIEEMGDEEILNILNRFGAMPSGEGFPTGEDFEAWRRAGVMIKVCDTADFYSHMYYSPACGWSLNLTGSEGFNTAYTYGEDGIAVGVAYKLRCEFAPTENQGWLKAVKITGEKARVISQYLSKLYEILPKGDQKTLAILYKLRRVDADDVFQRALISQYDPLGVTQNDVNYWDNLELEPIASLNGNISQVAKGFLYHNAKPEFQPQIKFPVVEMGGCVSFDFGAYAVPKDKPNCDTIMHGYYVGNNLKVIKYFVDWRGYQKQIESNYEPMMTVGSWEQTETSGSSSPQGYFYTTDFDFREVFSPVVTTTTIKGEDKGFDSKPFFSFVHFYAMSGDLWRNRYYTHLTKTNRTESEAINLAICIPYLTRNSAALAKKNTVIGITKSESLNLYAMQDPTTYRYWTYDFVFAWNTPLNKQTGKPYPVNGNPVWVEIEQYNPSEYSDFADQGSWLPGLPYDITWLIHPDTNQWNHSGGGGAPKVKEYSISNTEPSNTTGSLYFDISETPVQVNSQIPQEWYFYISPDEYGNVFYRDACKVVFGNSEYANISETDQNNLRYKWGYSSLVEHKSAYHFIGVINE